MATFSMTDVQVFAGAYDLQAQANSVTLDQTVDDLDATTFGSAGVKAHAAGLKDFTAQVEGFTDPLVTGQQFASLGGADVILTVSPTATAGAASYQAKGGLLSAFSETESLGELRKFSLNLSGRNPRGIVRSTILRAHSAATAGGTGTGYLIGTASAAQTVTSSVHLTALSGTATPTLTVTVQRDDNTGFTSPVTLHTHTALTAIGANVAETAGAQTDSYYRITWTLSGTTPSASFIVSLGIA